MNKDFSKYLNIQAEVQSALESGKAVVALESTIISHGMPYPQNAETALKVEKTIRDLGAVPATIAIINGQLKAGLTAEEIHYLGKKGHDVHKTSRRDMPMLIARKMDGATTVAGTMIVAALAGISVFATGGIGGVHRGAAQSMDISADLEELANTNVAVVSAGAKSILDLPLTLEYLETKGVPVVGYQTDEFPAFFTRESGLGVDVNATSPEEIAQMIQAKWDLGLQGGIIIANPVPQEWSMDKGEIDAVIDKALLEADKKNIKGKDITPFLLAKIENITQGKSLETNIELVLNNAKLAAMIAREFSKA